MEGERGRSSPRAGRPAAARSETQMRSLCYAAWEGTRRGASPCGRASGLCMSTGGRTQDRVAAEEAPIPTPSATRGYLQLVLAEILLERRSEERRVGKECRSRWSP